MKKLELKLNGKEMLTKDQLKKVNGGYDDCDMGSGCGCPSMCGGGSYYTCTDFSGGSFLNCIGGTYYSCTYIFGAGCTVH